MFCCSLRYCVQSSRSIYLQHSIVTLNPSDSVNNVLQCHTNMEGCCIGNRTYRWLRGEWLFPNGSAFRINGDGDDFYRNRGPGVVNLNWRNNSRIPTGLFCCVIPERPENPDSEQKACIGVYPEDEGNHFI